VIPGVTPGVTSGVTSGVTPAETPVILSSAILYLTGSHQFELYEEIFYKLYQVLHKYSLVFREFALH
jgi:hypothetical protein